jgi:hypothetical protein
MATSVEASKARNCIIVQGVMTNLQHPKLKNMQQYFNSDACNSNNRPHHKHCLRQCPLGYCKHTICITIITRSAISISAIDDGVD